jgi:PAS domain S-box-containing protein
MTEGDFAVRTEARGLGLTAELLQALDDLAGRLEARFEAARASEARYRRLFENSPAGLFRTRRDGRVLDCNPAAARMLGYDSVAEAKIHNARSFHANPADRDRLLDRLRGESLVANQLIGLRGKDGRVIPVLLTVQRTDGADGTSFDGQFIDASCLEVDVSGCTENPTATVMSG